MVARNVNESGGKGSFKAEARAKVLAAIESGCGQSIGLTMCDLIYPWDDRPQEQADDVPRLEILSEQDGCIRFGVWTLGGLHLASPVCDRPSPIFLSPRRLFSLLPSAEIQYCGNEYVPEVDYGELAKQYYIYAAAMRLIRPWEGKTEQDLADEIRLLPWEEMLSKPLTLFLGQETAQFIVSMLIAKVTDWATEDFRKIAKHGMDGYRTVLERELQRKVQT